MPASPATAAWWPCRTWSGWGDLAATCRFLQEQGAATVRVFLPGFTKLAASWLRFDPLDMYRKLSLFVRRQQDRMYTPLLLEPFLAGAGERLQAEVAGVLAGSPAERAGLQRGDVIGAVRGRQVRCRVEAFRTVERFGRTVLDVARTRPPGDRTAPGCIVKKRGEASGLVMNYDLDWETVDRVAEAIRRQPGKAGAGPDLRLGPSLAAVGPARVGEGLRRRAPGGRSQSLLRRLDSCCRTADNIRLRSRRQKHQEPGGMQDYDLLLLPGVAFDSRGRDLLGRPYTHLGALTKADVRIV